MYNFLGTGLVSYIFSAAGTKGFNEYNIEKMRNDFYSKGKTPKYKSIFLAFVLTALFGGYGMIYIAPRFGLSFAVADMALLPLFVFSIILRPIEIVVTILAVLSHNNVLQELETEFSLHENYRKREKQFFSYKRLPHVNGKVYRRNPYVS